MCCMCYMHVLGRGMFHRLLYCVDIQSCYKAKIVKLNCVLNHPCVCPFARIGILLYYYGLVLFLSQLRELTSYVPERSVF